MLPLLVLVCMKLTTDLFSVTTAGHIASQLEYVAKSLWNLT